MNLGFYIETNGGTPQNKDIYEFLNREIDSGTLEDAAVFFNSVNYNATETKFGMFDAANLWSFTGNLVTTSIHNLVKARAIANKLKLAYLYSTGDRNENSLFEIVRASKTVPVCVRNLLDYRDFARITGVEPMLLEELSLTGMRELFNGKSRE
jgi:hypothetical protein